MTTSNRTISARDELTAGSLRNHFLIAMPGMQDTAFAHTITYVCEHSQQGAMGLVINHTLPLTLEDIFGQMELSDATGIGRYPILAGGPVQIERGFVLHRGDRLWQSTLQVAPDINITSSRDIIAALAEGSGPKDYQIALGYAGWDAGQLEEEIASNAWLTLPADPAIIFDTPLEQRWSAAAQHLGIDLNLISSIAGHA